MKIGIVGFSFGLRSAELEPNPSNLGLGEEVYEAHYHVVSGGNTPVVVTQWEISKALMLEYPDVTVEHSVELRADGTYLDTQAVWDEAKAIFEKEGIHQVIIIAQPFLHLPSIKRMIDAENRDKLALAKEQAHPGKAYVYEVLDVMILPVPFDNSPLNTQPWTRTKFKLLVYKIGKLFGKKGGHDGMQQKTGNGMEVEI